MSVDRTSVRSARATKRLNRTLLVGALLGLTLSAGVAPSSMAWGEDGTPSESASAQTADAAESATGTPSRTTSDPLVDETTQTPTTDPSVTESSSPPDETALQAPESTPSEEAPAESADEPLQRSVEPMIAGPEQVSGPYVYWETLDGSNNLVGGAIYELQGPRTSNGTTQEWNVNWNGSVTVEDCIAASSAQCTGPDKDPDAGEFLVQSIGSHEISDSNRYRMRQVTPPSGYTFDASNNWKDIPGNRNAPTGWNTDTRSFDFGDFKVTKIPSQSPICEPGYVYGIRANGQIVQVTPSGAVSSLGSPSENGGSFNGLGVGDNGSPVFAYARSGTGNYVASNSQPRIYLYNTQLGTWESTGVRVPAAQTSGVTFVAGAVDLNTGDYYLGGYTGFGDSRVFRLWKYVKDATSVTYMGEIKAPGNPNYDDTWNSYNNGDIAFNSSGDLFVVRGYLTNTWVYSVTAADLAAGAQDGLIPSSASNQLEGTSSGVNGVAFDADGKGYLGADYTLTSYSMPNWSGKTTVTNDLASSTDLASCSSPPTITLEKYIDGNRVDDNDQFKFALKQGNTELGTATTAGSATGLQEQRVGPMPTAPGANLTFSETAASGNLNNYVSSWSCTADGEPITSGLGSGTTGRITIPSRVQDVNCRFTNTPMVAKVTIHKDIQGSDDTTLTPASDWTVGATGTATTGQITGTSPANRPTQVTSESGDASWMLSFDASTARATVTVSETMQAGYEFVRGACLVAKPGTEEPQEIELNGPSPQDIAGIAPGDHVTCGYVNMLSPLPKLTLIKDVANPAGSGYAGANDWTLSATGSGAAEGTTVSGATGVTEAVPIGGYSLTETWNASSSPDKSGGYQWTSLECINANGDPAQDISDVSMKSGDSEVDTAAVTLAYGDDVTCTYTNTPKLGSVSWQKVDENGNPLDKSVWTITGPAGVDPIEITDCVANTAADCTGADKDPAAGKFKVEKLVWGDYTLEEVKAPAGYTASINEKFTIDYENLNVEFDAAFKNIQKDGPVLPLTGGQSAILFTILGGGLIAAALALAEAKRRRAAHTTA